MKITLITAVYNECACIMNAVNSVLSQDYTDIEYIVVDGGSTDGTVEKLQPLADAGKLRMVSEPDKGLYDALNKGIRMATGDYIGLVHSNDCLFDKNVVSRVADELERTHCDLLYANGVYVADVNGKERVVRNWYGGTYSKRRVAMGWLPLHTTVYISRNAYLEYGLYDTSYHIAGDTNLLISYLYKQNLKVAFLDSYVIRMRIGGMSTSVWHTGSKWGEDIHAYHSYGLGYVSLLGKIARKFPQYLTQSGFYEYMYYKMKTKLQQKLFK